MYGKIFESIYDGTLYGQWEALVTFQQMIVLSDSEGVVDMTPPVLSARTSIPLNIIEKGIKVLESEDPYSRTPDNNGKRIELIDEHRKWGWRIINHRYYRNLASLEDKRQKDKERMRQKRSAERKNSNLDTSVAKCSKQSQKSPIQIQDTDTDTIKKIYKRKTSCPEDSPITDQKKKSGIQYSDDFLDFWSAYPKKKSKGQAWKAWNKLNGQRPTTPILIEKIKLLKNSDDWKKDGGQFIPYPASWLNAAGWEDEIEPEPDQNPMFNPANRQL